MAIRDLRNQKFGRLKALNFVYTKNGATFWNCECECGKQAVVRMGNLVSGQTKSCGCFKKEKASKMFSKHCHSSEKLYLVWKSMRKRCNNIKDKSYKHYGGQGIKVCDEWSTYLPFRKWAYENGYTESQTYNHKTIDRINPFGDYCPQNCRVADWVVQRHNRRSDYAKNL